MYRCQYEDTYAIIMSHFSERGATYAQLLKAKQMNGGFTSEQERSFAIVECMKVAHSFGLHLGIILICTSCLSLVSITGQTAWLVYMIGAIIGSRTSTGNSDITDSLDGQMISKSPKLRFIFFFDSVVYLFFLLSLSSPQWCAVNGDD